MTGTPLISIVTPIYNTPEPVFRAMVESVINQSFQEWELCLVDDASPKEHVRPLLEEYRARDPRVRVEYRTENGGIVAASNDSLAMARAPFVSFLDHDDELYPGALAAVVQVLNTYEDVDYVYTDEDKLTESGRRHSPFHKPDWSPERFRYQMYTCHFATMRTTLVNEVGGFRPECEGSQDFDLVFRVTERARRVVHIPRVLYGWRIIEGSAAGDVNAKPYAWIAGQRAIQDHCDRTGFEAEVLHDMSQPGWYRLAPRLTDHERVSIVIPTRGMSKRVRGRRSCMVVDLIERIHEVSTYDNYEIIVVLDTDVSAATRASVASALEDVDGRIVDYTPPFNFSAKINLGAIHAAGDHLLILNDDMDILTPNWLESLLMYSRQSGIGAVGAKLLFEDERIQHVGVVLSSAESGPSHPYRGFARDYPGYFSINRLANNYLAVTGACLMTRTELFNKVGGFSEQFPSSFNDVDYCLKLREAGYRVAYNPEVELLHFESCSRNPEVHPTEEELFLLRWESYLGNDPYYPKGLAPTPANFVFPAMYGVSTQPTARTS